MGTTKLTMKAATALDLTHAHDGRGPKTFQARQRLAAWLDTGAGSLAAARRDTAWLLSVAERAGGWQRRMIEVAGRL